MSGFLKIGHRGAMGYEPENTLGSFQKAIDLGADMVELDVRVCKSGELVVIHDEKVDRTTNGKGFVWSKTLSELQQLDAGKGQHIPTLKEVIEFIGKRVAINIELKGAATALPVAGLLGEYYKRGWNSGQFLVSSFDQEELRHFRYVDDTSRVGFIFDRSWRGTRAQPGLRQKDIFSIASQFNCYSIHPSIKLTTEQFVEDAHARGLKVFVWTVDSPDDIRRLADMGVDGIFSNFPDRLK